LVVVVVLVGVRRNWGVFAHHQKIQVAVVVAEGNQIEGHKGRNSQEELLLVDPIRRAVVLRIETTLVVVVVGKYFDVVVGEVVVGRSVVEQWKGWRGGHLSH
jgi:hypothetical protein